MANIFEIPLVRGIVGGLLLATVIALSVLFLTWVERKIIARIQVRYGPNRAGKFGLLQPIADAVKLLTKEDIIPEAADKAVFWATPIIAFAVAFLAWVTIPFTGSLVVSNLNIGVLYVLAVSSLAPIAVIMAGWAPNNKYNLLGGMRYAAHMISYEVPLVLSMMGVVAITRSLNLIEIVEAQTSSWFIFLQPLGFVVFFAAAVAEMGRIPFDLFEAEGELVAGWNTEFAGIKFSLLLFAEYIHMLVDSALIVILFLGGWLGPALFPPLFWFLLKMTLIILFLMWVRGTLPRIRIDQLLNFGWKLLLPLALVNIGVTGVILVL
ncbi:MAG: NADH-quinone oxidoreductase subunit NuoH [Candidatus Hydrothermarchaeales archaeon]